MPAIQHEHAASHLEQNGDQNPLFGGDNFVNMGASGTVR
jgi:hypothetical protein